MQVAMAMLVLVVTALLWGVASENHYCETRVPPSVKIHRYEGKMNVPIKPEEEPGKVLFLWPGVNPYGGEGGMMQPVLTYGVNYGQGERVWGMSNWFTNCPKDISSSGYCHDQYQAVQEGDTLSFAMQYYETFANGTQRWEMSWSALDGGQRSSFMVYWEAKDVSAIWATEAEFYLDPSVPRNYQKTPQSSYYTWDLKATTAEGAVYPLSYTTHGNDPTSIRVDCDLTVASGNTTYAHVTRLQMPSKGCSTGYSRAYNYGCNSYCGCTNSNGQGKIECDYCCAVVSGYCQREKGPSEEATNTTLKQLPEPEQGPPPGQLGRLHHGLHMNPVHPKVAQA